MPDPAAPLATISKTDRGYVVCRAWRLSPGRVAYVWLPCDAIARGERDDPALAEADLGPPAGDGGG